jgi:predicted nucleic acid-binding protein
MTQYLLDTNILLRAADTSSATYSLANNVITQIVETANECVIIPQVLIEFWVVATRPLDVNGLGWTPAQATNYVNDLWLFVTLYAKSTDKMPR